MKQLFKESPLWLRILIGVCVPAVCALGIAVLALRGSPFFCPFYALTHLYCPGCGAGRAATALVHFDFVSAIRNNMMFVIFIFPCAYYCLKMYIRFVFRKDILPWNDAPSWGYNTVAAAFILFWILRNIPVFPFTLLAPI